MKGVQSIERSISLMRLIAERNELGCTLIELTSLSGLTKSTIHRILQVLIQQRFIQRHPGTRRLHLGLEFFSLSSISANRLNLSEIARPIMLNLADLSGDTVFLSIRTGNHAVCLARIEGSYPIKALTLAVGSRRPLGMGAGSLALLASLSESASEEVISSNIKEIESYPGYDSKYLERLVRQTRARGYAINDGGIVSGMSAVGIAFQSTKGETLAALSIAAISKRMTGERRNQIIGYLRTALAELYKRSGTK